MMTPAGIHVCVLLVWPESLHAIPSEIPVKTSTKKFSLMEADADCFLLYPVHVDSSKPLSGGRRYSKSNCICKPTFREIKLALDALRLQYKEEASKRHPKDLLEKGRFSVSKLNSRMETVQRIVSMIRENRERSVQTDSRLKGNNFLNLVPAPRKRSKKK